MNFALQRVVSLQPSATLIMVRLGLLQRIVACTRHCLVVCPEAAGRLIVEDSWTAQCEQIASAAPDLVIASVPYQPEAVGEILKAGIRFLGLAPHSLNDIFSDIAAIAHLFEKSAEGAALIADMQRAIASTRQRTARATRPRAYCEEWGRPMLISQPWVKELVQAAGGEFIGEPGTRTSAEQVAATDPDVIVVAWCGAGDRVPLEKLVAERHWQELRAVRQGRVYCIQDELLTTPAPILTEGLNAIAAALHPELFPPAVGLRQIRAPAA